MTQKYEQAYRQSWESKSQLKNWLKPVLNNKSRAFCIYCKCEITARLSLLLIHSKSRKHMKSTKVFSSSKTRERPSHLIQPNIDDEFAQVFSDYACLTSDLPNQDDVTEDSYELQYEDKYADKFADSVHISDTYFKEETHKLRKTSNSKSSLIQIINEAIENGTIMLHDNKIYQKLPESSSIIDKQNSHTSSTPVATPAVEATTTPILGDEISTYANYVAVELRSIKQNYSRQLAKQKINSILFEACTGAYDFIGETNIEDHLSHES